jgi:hypothetical protein
MYIGDLRRKLFIPVDHEWNGVVREITAEYEESGGDVDAEVVSVAMGKYYRAYAHTANIKLNFR